MSQWYSPATKHTQLPEEQPERFLSPRQAGPPTDELSVIKEVKTIGPIKLRLIVELWSRYVTARLPGDL